MKLADLPFQAMGPQPPFAPEALERFVSAPRIAILSYTRRDGSPAQAPIWYRYEGARPVFANPRRMTRWLVAGTLLVMLASPAGAQTIGDKFLRGFAGMTTAFLEVPGNIVRETDRRGAGVGVPLGFAKGLGMIVPRVLVGVWEFVTAPFPVPPGYQPILEPEFPWSYFDASPPPRS